MVTNQNIVFQKDPSLEMQEAPDGFVVYDTQNGKVHFLNSTSASIFDMCDGAMSASDIAQNLKEAFDLAETPYSDVITCLNELSEKSLIFRCNLS